MEQTFEFVLNGTTYQTQKLTPILKGKIYKLLAYTHKETQGHTEEEIKALEWLQVAVAGAIYEHTPPVMWEFLSPATKQALGTKELFLESLDLETIAGFYNWAIQQVGQTQRFLTDTPAETQTNPA